MEKTKSDAASSFSEVLKELRTRKKWSRPRLAGVLGVSASAIEKWERGDVLPDRARVADLIRALKLPEEERLLLLEAHAGHRILPSLHNVPARNPYFTGREEILLQLYQRLVPGGQVELTQAISGLGGIGKTQLALQYLHRFQKVYSHVLWAAADSAAALVAEFVKLAADLQLLEKGEENQGKIVRAVQRWLREYVDWLLILDNVEDLGLVASFIPAGYLGSVLVTTRRQATEPIAQAIVLDVLNEDEGALLLLKRAKRLALSGSLEAATAQEVALARTLSEQLGGLPLALDQAGAYIVETGCSLSDFLDLFGRERTTLLQRRGTLKSDHPLSVTATFALALEQVRQKNAAALELLQTCAFLAPEAIPLEIITAGAAHLGATLGAEASDALRLDLALETLQAYSLVRRDGENRTLSIHRLVQAVLKDTLTEGERRSWTERVLRALNAAFPRAEPSAWPECERLLPHALLMAQATQAYGIRTGEAARLLHETASYLQDRARYEEAEPLFQRALGIREETLGPVHPDVAATLNGLAIVYRRQAKYAQAEPPAQRALHIREEALGPDHPEVAATLDNLAELYREQNKYAEAEPLYQRALGIQERTLGPDHPDVASPLNNLAELYREQGKYAEAEPLYQRALHIWQHTRGPGHPDVAYALTNLAILYTEQDRYAEAEPLHLQAAEIWKQALGQDHTFLAYSCNALGELYREQGRYSEAESFYTQALSIWERSQTPDHPYMAYPLNGLAELHRKQGRYAEAEPLYRRALRVWEQSQRPDHPNMADALDGLAELYREQGRYAEAEPLYTQAIAVRERHLGPEHLDTALSLQYFAAFQESQGRSSEAASLYQRVLGIREQILGPGHTKTVETRERYTALLRTMGQQDPAAPSEEKPAD